MDELSKTALTGAMKEKTGPGNPGSVAQLKSYLIGKGIEDSAMPSSKEA